MVCRIVISIYDKVPVEWHKCGTNVKCYKKNLKKKFQLKLKNATSTKFNFGDNYDIYFLPHPLKKIQKIRD